MKKIVFAILCGFTGSAAHATSSPEITLELTQTPATLAQRAQAITTSMVKSLHLNAAQAQKLQAVNLASLQSAETAKEKYKNDPRQAVAYIEMISQGRLSKIKDILTPEQFQQYQQRREEKMGVPQEAQSNPQKRQDSLLHQESY